MGILVERCSPMGISWDDPQLFSAQKKVGWREMSVAGIVLPATTRPKMRSALIGPKHLNIYTLRRSQNFRTSNVEGQTACHIRVRQDNFQYMPPDSRLAGVQSPPKVHLYVVIVECM